MFTQSEVGIMIFALNQTKDGQARRFQFVELAKVADISKKFQACVKDDKIVGDQELDFNAEEKVFIKEKIEELGWQTGDAEHVLSLVEKLK